MEFDPQDLDIVALLTRLKDTAGEYPEQLFVGRRQSFLKQMTEVSLGIGTTGGIKNSLKKTNISKVFPFTGTLLEAALIAAIVLEASAMAYIYRERLADFFQTITANSKIEQAIPPVFPTSLEVESTDPSPTVTSTLTSATPILEPALALLTPTGTPIPGATLGPNQLSATPDPKGNNGNHYGQTPKPERTKDNNGNHYGQTPKPERTKDNNGNNGGNGNNDNNGNNDKDPKPTKDK
jgi:hypothetical protein